MRAAAARTTSDPACRWTCPRQDASSLPAAGTPIMTPWTWLLTRGITARLRPPPGAPPVLESPSRRRRPPTSPLSWPSRPPRSLAGPAGSGPTTGTSYSPGMARERSSPPCCSTAPARTPFRADARTGSRHHRMRRGRAPYARTLHRHRPGGTRAGDTARPRRRRLSYRLDGPRIFLHPGGIPALATLPDVPHSHELSPGSAFHRPGMISKLHSAHLLISAADQVIAGWLPSVAEASAG